MDSKMGIFLEILSACTINRPDPMGAWRERSRERCVGGETIPSFHAMHSGGTNLDYCWAPCKGWAEGVICGEESKHTDGRESLWKGWEVLMVDSKRNTDVEATILLLIPPTWVDCSSREPRLASVRVGGTYRVCGVPYPRTSHLSTFRYQIHNAMMSALQKKNVNIQSLSGKILYSSYLLVSSLPSPFHYSPFSLTCLWRRELHNR